MSKLKQITTASIFKVVDTLALVIFLCVLLFGPDKYKIREVVTPNYDSLSVVQGEQINQLMLRLDSLERGKFPYGTLCTDCPIIED